MYLAESTPGESFPTTGVLTDMRSDRVLGHKLRFLKIVIGRMTKQLQNASVRASASALTFQRFRGSKAQKMCQCVLIKKKIQSEEEEKFAQIII